MTGVAHIRRIKMVWSFTAGRYAIVTGDTVIDERRMIYSGRYPLLCTVAITTFLRCWHMVGALASGNHIVMTAGTNTQHLIMVHGIVRHRYPGCRAGLVTRVAGIRGIDVISTFAGGNRSVVATRTRTDNLRMINGAWLNGRPGGREYRMTGVALIRTVNVVGTLAARNDAVMAIGAVIHKRGMIRRAAA